MNKIKTNILLGLFTLLSVGFVAHNTKAASIYDSISKIKFLYNKGSVTPSNSSGWTY